MKRRGMIAGVATTVGVAVTGATTWLFTRENDGNKSGPSTSSERDQNESGNDTAKGGEAPQASKEDVENQSEHPEAATPEPDPQGPDTNESAINESAAGSEPTAEDVTLSNTELVTESNMATVTGVATNESDEPVTVDLEVQFLQDGEQLGRPALGGTTGLQPGDSWDFTISARESGVSEVTDYEIAPTVQPATR